MAEIMLFYLKAYFFVAQEIFSAYFSRILLLKFGKKVTIFTIRKENIEKKERTRMKKVEKRNFQSVKTKPGYVRTALPLLLLVVLRLWDW